MANYQLVAKRREEKGKTAARRLRREKKVPAILYGPDKENIDITLELGDIQKALHSGATLYDVQVDGETHTVMLKDTDFDPVKGDVIHMDLYLVTLDKLIHTTVPIRLTNEDKKENDGGVLNHVLREVEVSCLPMDIPEIISIDLSGLKIGDSVFVKDLDTSDKVEVLTDPEEVVITISQPDAEPVEEEEALEPAEPVEVGSEEDEAEQE